MIDVGIDEYTIVFRISSLFKYLLKECDWQSIVNNIIEIFSQKANFEGIFGKRRILENSLLKGYSYGYTFGEHSFYFAVAFNENRHDMGVAVKFSAQALDYYCNVSGIKPYELLKNMEDDFYDIRLSRVDLVVDYINESIDVTEIYNHLTCGKIDLFKEYVNEAKDKTLYKKINMKLSGYVAEKEVSTVYLGSPHSNARLRIYDKKKEQIDNHGTKYDKAVMCNDWVRFEGVFRHDYAHQLGCELMNLKTDDEFTDLIANTMLQKYRFMYVDNGIVDCETEYTRLLIDAISNRSITLKTSQSRNYDLLKSIHYLFCGSGVIATLYKIKSVWGENSLYNFLLLIKDYVDSYIPNYDCELWLRKNEEDYKKFFPDFYEFISTRILPYIS